MHVHPLRLRAVRAGTLLACWLAVVLPVAAQNMMMPGGGGSNGPKPAKNITFEDRVLQEGGAVFRPADAVPVAEVRIVGNRRVDTNEVFKRIKTRQGRQYDPQVVEADIRSLTASRLFRNVRVLTEQSPAGMVVTFEVFERPTIEYLRIVGNRSIRDKTLLKQAGVRVGDPLNQYSIEDARRKIEEYYHSKGFAQVHVSIFEGNQPQDRGVVLLVNEGPIQRISSVQFVGNTIATDGRLKALVQSKPGILWYLFRGKVDRAKIDEDVEKLTAYYRSLGYFNAKIGRELSFDDENEWLKLTFVIDEGIRWRIRNVSVVGNQRFERVELENELQLAPGEYFNQAKMTADLSALRDFYGGQGYVFADVKADPRFLEEPGELDLIYSISEGDLFRVARINIHIAGEFPHTRRNVVLNRISLRPGDIIDMREVRNSERRLKASQLFENNPAQGIAPKIVIRPPELEEAALAEGGEKPVVRGQSPDGPKTRWIVVDVVTPPLKPFSLWPWSSEERPE